MSPQREEMYLGASSLACDSSWGTIHIPGFCNTTGSNTRSSSDDDQPHEIPFSSSDEDESIPIDAMAVILYDNDLAVQTDPEERMPNSDRELFITS
jgi:hypothetical protein